MCGGSSSPPQVPDPNQTAANQQNLNLQSGITQQAASNPNYINPYSATQSIISEIGPDGIPIYTQVQTPTPATATQIGLQQGGQALAGGAALNQLQNQFGNLSGQPDLSNNAGSLVDKQMQQFQSYYGPLFQQQTAQTDTQLRNQGILPGTPAYDQAMRQNADNQGRQITAGLMQFQPQAFNQAVTTSQLPYQDIGQLLSMNQPTLGAPIAGGQASYAPANLTGAVASATQAQEQAYQSQLAQQAAMFQGLGQLGIGAASLFKTSDRRLKTDIEQVGLLFDGTPIYRYRLKGKNSQFEIGLMAQDIQDEMPEAVKPIIHGYLGVDYKKATDRSIDVFNSISSGTHCISVRAE